MPTAALVVNCYREVRNAAEVSRTQAPFSGSPKTLPEAVIARIDPLCALR